MYISTHKLFECICISSKTLYISSMDNVIYILTKHPPSAGFPSPSGGVALSAPIWVTAAFGGGERNEAKINIKNLGRHERPIYVAPAAPRPGRQLTPP